MFTHLPHIPMSHTRTAALSSLLLAIVAGVFIFAPTSLAANPYAATIANNPNPVVNLIPEKAMTYSVTYSNTGITTWPEQSGGTLYLKTISSNSPIRHHFWPTGNIAAKTNSRVDVNDSLTVSFAIQAPETIGLFTETLALVDERGTLIPGSLFKITINSTLSPDKPFRQPTASKAAVLESTQPALPQPTETQPSLTPPEQTNTTAPQVAGVSTVQQLPLFNEPPTIRVGIDYPDDKRVVVTADGLFGLFDAQGVKQGTYGAGTFVTIQYAYGVYNVILPSGTFSLSSTPTFKPLDTHTILEVASFSRTVPWNTSINDNRFRGNLEINYNPNTNRLWIINVLPIEQYIAGIDEVSNIDVPELHKALSVAVRTYALYHLMDNTKHAGFFHVNDDYDQIYRGYNSERRHGYFVAEAVNTAGQVITYNNEVVVTPYFTQSNGATKSYAEVWGSHVSAPHLQAVSVPHDVGKSLLGHGVGMSAQGAQRMAYLDNQKYIPILQHFYTGVEISKVY